MSDKAKWELSADDTLTQRARTLASIALADVVHNALVVEQLLPRATLRMIEALECYERMDLRKSTGK